MTQLFKGLLVVLSLFLATSSHAENHLVDGNLMFVTLDAGGNDEFHTGRMAQVHYNYFFNDWLAASVGFIITEPIPETPIADIAGTYRGIVKTKGILLGVRPEYAFSERNKVYGRISVLGYQTRLEVEQFFDDGLPSGTTTGTTEGYGYMLGGGWAHNFTPRFSMQFELSWMQQLDLFSESPRSFDLTSASFGLGLAYAF